MSTSKNVYQCGSVCGSRRLFLFSGMLLLTIGIIGGMMFRSHRRTFAASAENAGPPSLWFVSPPEEKQLVTFRALK